MMKSLAPSEETLKGKTPQTAVSPDNSRPEPFGSLSKTILNNGISLAGAGRDMRNRRTSVGTVDRDKLAKLAQLLDEAEEIRPAEEKPLQDRSLAALSFSKNAKKTEDEADCCSPQNGDRSSYVVDKETRERGVFREKEERKGRESRLLLRRASSHTPSLGMTRMEAISSANLGSTGFTTPTHGEAVRRQLKAVTDFKLSSNATAAAATSPPSLSTATTLSEEGIAMASASASASASKPDEKGVRNSWRKSNVSRAPQIESSLVVSADCGGTGTVRGVPSSTSTAESGAESFSWFALPEDATHIGDVRRKSVKSSFVKGALSQAADSGTSPVNRRGSAYAPVDKDTHQMAPKSVVMRTSIEAPSAMRSRAPPASMSSTASSLSPPRRLRRHSQVALASHQSPVSLSGSQDTTGSTDSPVADRRHAASLSPERPSKGQNVAQRHNSSHALQQLFMWEKQAEQPLSGVGTRSGFRGRVKRSSGGVKGPDDAASFAQNGAATNGKQKSDTRMRTKLASFFSKRKRASIGGEAESGGGAKTTVFAHSLQIRIKGVSLTHTIPNIMTGPDPPPPVRINYRQSQILLQSKTKPYLKQCLCRVVFNGEWQDDAAICGRLPPFATIFRFPFTMSLSRETLSIQLLKKLSSSRGRRTHGMDFSALRSIPTIHRSYSPGQKGSAITKADLKFAEDGVIPAINMKSVQNRSASFEAVQPLSLAHVATAQFTLVDTLGVKVEGGKKDKLPDRLKLFDGYLPLTYVPRQHPEPVGQVHVEILVVKGNCDGVAQGSGGKGGVV